MGNRRFEMHQYRNILVRMRLGESDRDIAKAGLMGRRKAREVRSRAREAGWLELDHPLPDNATLAATFGTSTPKASTTSSVAPYAEEIGQWREAGVSGVVILRALQNKHGFTGHYSSVRRFLQQLEVSHPKPTVILDFAPGEAAQVDFGSGPKLPDPDTGELVSTWFFVMTLCWSRHQYAEFVRDQKVATWLSCHRRAFEWFVGVPTRVIIDNPKCAITRACYHDPEVQRSYGELAEGYGFLISPCPPRDPQKKGIVESGVKYVKRNFLPLREFRDLVDANHQLSEWVLSTAGNRIHGTTKQKPLTRFAETERHVLSPLPAVAPQMGVWKKVKLHPNCHAQFEKCSYSAPFRLIGKELWLRSTAATVELYHDHELVAVHPRKLRPGSRSSVEDHLPPEAVAYLMRDPQWCLTRSETVGPSCHELIEALFSHRVLDNLRAAQGVLRLGDRFGAVRLEAACTRALAFDNPKYRTVKTILEKGLDQIEPLPETPLGDAYTGKGRFTRDASQLFVL